MNCVITGVTLSVFVCDVRRDGENKVAEENNIN